MRRAATAWWKSTIEPLGEADELDVGRGGP